jgi:hypothetical protein
MADAVNPGGLLEAFIPRPDVTKSHKIVIDAPAGIRAIRREAERRLA